MPPPGAAAILFLKEPVSDLATNKGTGGDMTPIGNYFNAATSPSD